MCKVLTIKVKGRLVSRRLHWCFWRRTKKLESFYSRWLNRVLVVFAWNFFGGSLYGQNRETVTSGRKSEETARGKCQQGCIQICYLPLMGPLAVGYKESVDRANPMAVFKLQSHMHYIMAVWCFILSGRSIIYHYKWISHSEKLPDCAEHIIWALCLSSSSCWQSVLSLHHRATHRK